MAYTFEDYVEDVELTLPRLRAKKAVLFGDMSPVGLVKMVALELFITEDAQESVSNVAFKTKSILRQVNNFEPIDWGY
jgi:hypothetical protein